VVRRPNPRSPPHLQRVRRAKSRVVDENTRFRRANASGLLLHAIGFLVRTLRVTKRSQVRTESLRRSLVRTLRVTKRSQVRTESLRRFLVRTLRVTKRSQVREADAPPFPARDLGGRKQPRSFPVRTLRVTKRSLVRSAFLRTFLVRTLRVTKRSRFPVASSRSFPVHALRGRKRSRKRDEPPRFHREPARVVGSNPGGAATNPKERTKKGATVAPWYRPER
jgi:hypothetical protein